MGCFVGGTIWCDWGECVEVLECGDGEEELARALVVGGVGVQVVKLS